MHAPQVLGANAGAGSAAAAAHSERQHELEVGADRAARHSANDAAPGARASRTACARAGRCRRSRRRVTSCEWLDSCCTVAAASYHSTNPAWWTRTEYSQSSWPKKYSSGRSPTRSIVRAGSSITAPEMNVPRRRARVLPAVDLAVAHVALPPARDEAAGRPDRAPCRASASSCSRPGPIFGSRRRAPDHGREEVRVAHDAVVVEEQHVGRAVRRARGGCRRCSRPENPRFASLRSTRRRRGAKSRSSAVDRAVDRAVVDDVDPVRGLRCTAARATRAAAASRLVVPVERGRCRLERPAVSGRPGVAPAGTSSSPAVGIAHQREPLAELERSGRRR